MSLTPARSLTESNLLRQLDYSILQQCIHCGMCLPTCPTYDATKHETSSPRGRIALMRAVADGRLAPNSPQFADEMYFCLGCLACETACPAGVNYAEMIEYARAEVESSGAKAGTKRNFIRAFALRWLFAKPGRLHFVARLLRLDQTAGFSKAISALLPKHLRELRALQPRICSRYSFDLIREHERSPLNAPRYHVGLLTGCVQDVAYADVNRDTVDVLLANGCEAFTPRTQVCCGSLMGHNGELQLARRLALQNLDAFPLEHLDAIIVNSAGCGSFMKRYGDLLPDESRARLWDEKVYDIHEWLVKIGIHFPPDVGRLCESASSHAVSQKRPTIRVTYHEACHLVHGQKISQQPRELLRAIPGVELVELPEAMWCCGSAGIYNITQPEMSMALLERKMRHIAATGAQVVATGNPGCIGQIRYGAKRFGMSIKVVHPVTLLARAYRGEM
jgi:glycolate oxidase iron-sulfur subunit